MLLGCIKSKELTFWKKVYKYKYSCSVLLTTPVKEWNIKITMVVVSNQVFANIFDKCFSGSFLIRFFINVELSLCIHDNLSINTDNWNTEMYKNILTT